MEQTPQTLTAGYIHLALFLISWSLFYVISKDKQVWKSKHVSNLNPHCCRNCTSCRNTQPCSGTYGSGGWVWAPTPEGPRMWRGWTNPQTLCNDHCKVRKNDIYTFTQQCCCLSYALVLTALTHTSGDKELVWALYLVMILSKWVEITTITCMMRHQKTGSMVTQNVLFLIESFGKYLTVERR